MKLKIPIPNFNDSKILKEINTVKKDLEKSEKKTHKNDIIDNNLSVVAVSTLMLLITLTVYTQVQSSFNTTNFGVNVSPLISLLPLVLIGAFMIGIVSVFFRF